MTKRYPYQGELLSITAIARRSGVDRRTVGARIATGLTAEEAVSAPVIPRRRHGPEPKRYLLRGQWVTLGEAATLMGCTLGTARKRVSGDRIIDDEARSNAVLLPFKGVRRSVIEWAAITGIKRETIHSRLFKGWTVERALSTPTHEPRRYAFAGRNLTVSEWSRVTGIPVNALNERLRSKRWTLKRALTEPSLTATERCLIRRNRRLIARMAAAFGPTSPTGGYAQTSSKATGTGGGSSVSHFDGARRP